MRTCLYLLIVIFFSFYSEKSHGQPIRYDKVKIYIHANEDIQRLSSLGIPLDGVYIKKNEYIIGEFSENDIQKLNSNGFHYEVLIQDVSKFYEERNKSSIDTLKKKVIKSACFEKYATPNNFTLGSVGGYFSYQEIVAQLDSIHNKFPQLVSAKFQLNPLSIEGRKLWCIKISDNPNVDENEPRVLFVALNHAREPMGMQQLFFLMYYLVENYANDTTIQYLVNNLEIYFIPCVNPDGYVYNNTTNPNGGGMHRKNCRVTGASNFGVDLNRNYGYMWGYDDIGSSPDMESETYRGTAAFSEPETQAIKAFVEQKQFIMVMDYHCYSNVLLYPWSYTNMVTPDNNSYRAWSEIMTETNGFFYGTPMEAIGYNANGGSMDWYYGEQTTKPKTIVWSPEAGNVNDGFYPSSNRIISIAKSFMDMNMYFLHIALPYINIQDKSSRFLTNGQRLKFSMKNLGITSPTSFSVTFIPVSPELQATQFQHVYSNLPFLQSNIDSFPIVLNETQSWSKELRYCYKVETALGYYYTDTFSFVCGAPVDLLSDNCNTLSNWTSNTWNTTSMAYYSPPKSITDSPNGTYPENSTRIITLSNSFSLQNAQYAELSYWCKWDIEPLADYVQIQISTNNGSTWQPLCGKHTHRSFLTNTYNQPIYEGLRDHWVQERIDLNDYLGMNNIKIRFKLQSSYSYTMENDGFYFDDLKIQIIQPFSENSILNNPSTIFSIYPNPTKGRIIVNYSIPEQESKPELHITNLLSTIRQVVPLDKNQQEVHLTLNLKPGIYWCTLTGEHIISKPIKLIIE
ncbi:MAG: M14 family zinc carboxypeptidase [Bacteroidales bacterium]|nr:M14 family zinc carboxypeptidase [Bacteroidales bacterium]